MAKLRIPGVLQRFAITYFVVASTGLLFLESLEFSIQESKFSHYFKDLFCLYQRWFVAILFLVLHSLLTFCLPVPGCPTGYLGPAGLHLDGIYNASCVGGAAGYIDRVLFGTNHIYGNPTSKPVYASGPYDPEGFLGKIR